MQDPKAIVAKFREECFNLGFKFHTHGTVVTILKHFVPGNTHAYTACDIDGPYLLSLLPTTSAGSVWGTDGGSVGGHIALTNGTYVLNKSGVSKRVLKELMKIQDTQYFN